MEASPVPRHHLPPPPTDDRIKQKLINNGVPNPSPKIIHTLRKKQAQKYLRKRSRTAQTLISLAEEREAAEDEHFRALKSEYKTFVGNPWEGLERVKMREMVTITDSKGYGGDGLKREHLRELGEFLGRERERFKWLLDDDVEVEEGWMGREKQNWVKPQRQGGDAGAIRFLVDKLSSTELSVKDWKFSRMMRQSELQFTEGQLLKIVGGLGDKGQWKHAISVVEWVYSSKEHRLYKSRFVYTKLLAVLGKAQRPHEALKIFDVMSDDAHIYPDMPAYHSITVTLGQAGYLKELIKIIESMSKKPSKRIKNMRYKNWDPALQPDIVVFNAVLNACVPSRQWKGVSWVFQQLRKHGLKPNGPTYGLAMEVMLQSGKYDLVHEFFGKMKRSGEAPKALTYKVLVRSFWEEDKVDEAIEAVRDMEQRGVVGVASVYYELACCLCNKGRWKEAMTEVTKLKSLSLSKPLQVTFTGMILSSLDGGHVHDCISIFQQSKDHCAADVGLINAMLKVYGSYDMFSEAKELFEEVKRSKIDSNKSVNDFGSALSPDAYTYTMMLKASASSHQWEYFEFMYREMILSGHMIDQSKHVTLLVEASRAGKWHLLEHTFDTILEGGEIPCLSFFTELICQAIIHSNFERVASLISALAHAPWQISEKQWFDLFERNGDRISKENLREFSEILGNCELPVEATVSNLKRSLVSYCRFGSYKEVISVDRCPSTGNSENLSSDKNVHMNDSFVNSLRINQCDDLHHDSEIDVLDVAYGNSDNEDDVDPTISESFDHSCSWPRKGAKKCTTLEDLAFGETSDDSDNEFSESFECIDTDDEEMEDGMQIGVRGSADRNHQPSASEILELWKQSREKNGTLLKFQFGS